jgi:nicotinamide-nucleotide amidase
VSESSLPSAVILAVGSELTTGSTRDTNSGELAAELTAMGIEVLWTQALRDDLADVRDAFLAGLARADLVVSTGGLGPTPDDLTREAIAAAAGLEPSVDPALERWLRGVFDRRGSRMPETNLKQAWLVPGASPLQNGNGTAPGWWLELGEKLVVALPGPPREMWPMWRAEVRPRLEARGLGRDIASETLRLTGIGESALAELIGAELARGGDPEVATYARADAVDVRISSRGPAAADRVAAMREQIEPRLVPYVFAHGDDGWPETLARVLGKRTVALVEGGTGGTLVALLGTAPFLVHAELLDAPDDSPADLAQAALAATKADLAIVLLATSGEEAIDATIAITGDGPPQIVERRGLAAGAEGRRRAALAACAELWRRLRAKPQ